MSTKSAGKRSGVDGSTLRSVWIRSIHVIRQVLQITEEDFVAILRRQFRVESLPQLPEQKLRLVLEDLLRRRRIEEQKAERAKA